MYDTADAGRTRSLLLVGHGSELSPDASRPVREHAERIRRSGHFHEVGIAFWKEEPFLRGALERCAGDDLVVVPFFLADGYYTRQVVPRELGLGATTTDAGGRRLFYAPPVGTHPRMEELILRRAVEACAAAGTDPRDAALLVIGHGTERSATSGGTTWRVTTRLAAREVFGAVDCGFLDEDPHVREVMEAQDARTLVLVPFFAAEGWHTRTTIPRDLGLDGERTERDGRVLWYTPPVGTFPEMADLIAEIASETAARNAA